MKTQKYIQLILTLLFTFTAIAGNWVFASAKANVDTITRKLEYQKSADIYLRNGGVYFPASAYTATATLTRIDLTEADRASAKKLLFTQPWLDIRVRDSAGAEFKKIYGIIYVYFNLSSEDRTAWDQGKLSIYYYDALKKSWQECPSRLLAEKGSQNGRVSCMITEGFGRYGMATKR